MINLSQISKFRNINKTQLDMINDASFDYKTFKFKGYFNKDVIYNFNFFYYELLHNIIFIFINNYIK
jgi:hypothetical protein